MTRMAPVRSTIIAAMCALPCVLGLAWAGCATAGDVDDVPPKPIRDSGVGGGDGSNDGGGSGDGGGGDGGGGDGSVCGPTSTPNACTSATDVGTVSLAGKSTASGAVPLTGGDLWYKITFDGLGDLAAHPKIVLTSADDAIAFEVVRSCAGERVSCGDEGGEASGVREYEVAYRPAAGDDAGPGPDPDASGDAVSEAGVEAGVFAPIPVGDKGTVYLRVYRKAGAPKACAFELQISN